ncbi:MAG: tRNA glutamyl-Q(34) synthetase GluQRS [Acidimicrobiales bacterium]
MMALVMAIGRFAPSPTGPLHLGNLRTALLAWLFARSAGSAFFLRMDDLDSVASRPELIAGQLADLEALGLDWDGEVVFQSRRHALHEAALQRLVDAGLTYPCYCTRREIREATLAPHGPNAEGRYPGTCRDLTSSERARGEGRTPALRLRGESTRFVFIDRVCGRFEGVVDDVVIARNDGTPAYNLAVVVDDHDMGIEEVVRGDDLLHATPAQLLVARSLGYKPPSYAHVPLLRGPDGERLSKRHGAITLGERLTLGQRAGEVRAELAASVGLCAPGEQPSINELLASFDPSRLNKPSKRP